jgi:osmotically-inducible protein OsmY
MGSLQLRQDISEELEFEPSVNAAHIGVAVEVSDRDERHAVENAAWSAAGVRSVEDRITVG